MGYKVEYGALDSWCGAIGGQASDWQEKLEALATAMQTLVQSKDMSGQGADNLKEYIRCTHLNLINQLMGLVAVHAQGALLYKTDYQKNIDTGLHVLILEDELDEVKTDIANTRLTATSIGDNLFYTMNGIKDIFNLKFTDVSAVVSAHQAAEKVAEDLHQKIKDLEKKHANEDFVESKQLISALTSVIAELQDQKRSFRTDFTIDKLDTPAWSALVTASVGIEKSIEKQAAMLDEAIQNEKDRAAAFLEEEEAKEDRQWAKWLAVGIAAAGSVVLIVVTAGGATPLVCAGVGAATGLATAASSGLADQYVETGSLDDMDWSDFGKKCVIGTATGFVSGYAGALSMGTAIKQPIQAGLQSAGTAAAKSLAGGVIDTAWDVGEAWVYNKPGDEIKSVLLENLAENGKDLVVDTAEGFAGGYVGGHFKVDAGDKSFLQQLGADSAENIAKAATKNFTDSAWDVGAALLDGDSSTTFGSAAIEEIDDFIGGTAKDFISNEIEDVVSNGIDKYQDGNKKLSDTAKTIQNIVGDTAGKTAGTFVGSATKQTVEVIAGERTSVDVGEIWEKDLDGGRNIVKDAVESAGKNIYDQAKDDKKVFYNQLKNEADENGQVEVVKFDKYQVLKKEYDAAEKVAGKGAYKDKTVNEILGLSEKEKIDRKNLNVEKEYITDLEKSKYKTKQPTNATTLKRSTNATREKYEEYDKKKK